VEAGEVVSQYQTEIPAPHGVQIEFRIQVGCCRGCRRRVQGRHPRQTSDAIGSAASELGPRAVALTTQLNKGLGLPYGKTAAVLEQAFGLRVTRKVWGGNRTIHGARTQGVLVSIRQSCRQQLRPVSSCLQKLICSPQPKVMDLTLPAISIRNC